MRFRPYNPSYHTKYSPMQRAPQSAFARELYRAPSPEPVIDMSFLDSPRIVPAEDPQYLSIENAPASSLWKMAYSRRMSRAYRKTRRSGKYSRRRGARKFQRRVKKAVLRTAETKFSDLTFENRQLYHNLGSEPSPPGVVIPVNVTSSSDWFNPWSKIPRGTARFERIGDRITPRGMSIKLYLANKDDRPNTMYRVIVAVLPKEVNGSVTTNVFDPFQVGNIGAIGNNMILPADHDIGVKFLYDRIIRLPQDPGVYGPGARKEFTKVVRLWIKSKRSRQVVYSGVTGSTQIVNKPLAVYCIPYEQYSTLTTDKVGSWAGHMRMYYKDV